MMKEFTIDIGRFHKGAIHDYPKHVWEQIARDAKKPLDKFTSDVEANVALRATRSTHKQRPEFKPRARVPAAQR